MKLEINNVNYVNLTTLLNCIKSNKAETLLMNALNDEECAFGSNENQMTMVTIDYFKKSIDIAIGDGANPKSFDNVLNVLAKVDPNITFYINLES